MLWCSLNIYLLPASAVKIVANNANKPKNTVNFIICTVICLIDPQRKDVGSTTVTVKLKILLRDTFLKPCIFNFYLNIHESLLINANFM